MKKLTVSILFLLVMAGVPSAAYAVTAIIRVLDDSDVVQKSYTVPSANPLTLNLSANPATPNPATPLLKGYGTGPTCETTGVSTGFCFTVSAQAIFLQANNILQLKLSAVGSSGGKVVIKNTGSVLARLKIEYQHKKTTFDPRSTVGCFGSSGDGWFSGTTAANNPAFLQTMSVVFTGSSGEDHPRRRAVWQLLLDRVRNIAPDIRSRGYPGGAVAFLQPSESETAI